MIPSLLSTISTEHAFRHPAKQLFTLSLSDGIYFSPRFHCTGLVLLGHYSMRRRKKSIYDFAAKPHTTMSAIVRGVPVKSANDAPSSALNQP
jgi:hypothetical protein